MDLYYRVKSIKQQCWKYIVAARRRVHSGFGSVVLIMYGFSRKGTGFARFLIAIHVLCMSIASLIFMGVGVTAYSWNLFDETDSRFAQRKESLRSVHRFANTFSGLLFIVGLSAIVFHFWIKEHTLLHDKSVHTLLGLLALLGVLIQVMTGMAKIGAMRSKKKKFKFHGVTGWFTFVLVYLTVNSGIAESGFFVNLISTQMILQSMLLLNLLLIAFATKRLPAIKIKCVNPFVYLINEWLYVLPRPISNCCRKYCCFCKGIRGEAEVYEDEQIKAKPGLD